MSSTFGATRFPIGDGSFGVTCSEHGRLGIAPTFTAAGRLCDHHNRSHGSRLTAPQVASVTETAAQVAERLERLEHLARIDENLEAIRRNSGFGISYH